MSKYAALRDHLMSLKSDHWQASFEEIERILGGPLTQSARRYPAWWANQNPRSHVQCSGWLDAGWRTANLNISAERVTFLRSGSASDIGEEPVHKSTKSSLEWDDVLGPGDGDHASLSVHYGWRALGNVFIDDKGRLTFPRMPFAAAIYKFVIRQGQTEKTYIGETDEVSRRFQHYRTPGLTQRTNQRINTAMEACLKGGGEVDVSIIEQASAEWGGTRRELDLSEKLQRRLVEHAAIVAAQLAHEDVINL